MMDTQEKAPGSAGTLTRAAETAKAAIPYDYLTAKGSTCQEEIKAACMALKSAEFELKRAVALLKLAGWEGRTSGS